MHPLPDRRLALPRGDASASLRARSSGSLARRNNRAQQFPPLTPGYQCHLTLPWCFLPAAREGLRHPEGPGQARAIRCRVEAFGELQQAQLRNNRSPLISRYVIQRLFRVFACPGSGLMPSRTSLLFALSFSILGCGRVRSAPEEPAGRVSRRSGGLISQADVG